MKKYILFLLVSLVTYGELFADGYAVKRSLCFSFLSWKFKAGATNSVFATTKYQTGYNCIGQWMGTGLYGNWTNICDNDNGGCSRPQTAICGTNAGNAYDRVFTYCNVLYLAPRPYSCYAKADYQIGGFYLTKIASGRGSAGQAGEYMLNELAFNQLNDNGSSEGDIHGDSYIDANNNLVITGLSGQMKITQSTDYYSSLKVIVIKENNITQQMAKQNEQDAIRGTYNGIVYTTEIRINKNGYAYSGAFANNMQSISPFTSPSGFKGLTITNLGLTQPLEAQLAEDESLTIITVLDGGFDISSAIIPQKPTAVPTVAEASQYEVSVYPNPATQTISLKFYSNEDNAPVQVTFYDVTSKLVKTLYSGNTVKGSNNINNIEVSSLPRGYHFLKVTNGKTSITKGIALE